MTHRISSSPETMKPDYRVVVVGSGYGGGVAASRLARAGQTVCLLERGKELWPGEYPVNEIEALAQMQLDLPQGHEFSDTGLFDFRVNDDINVLVGCGLGGTSLINANVGLEPDPRVFDDPRWPAGLRNDLNGLREGVARAQHTLGAKRYPQTFPALPKLTALGMVADRLHARLERPPLYVTFEDGTNEAGVEQKACILCGDCVTGCNHWAKNTTLMNYLTDARNHGAEIFCEVGVRWVERSSDGRWAVRYQLLGAGRQQWSDEPMAVIADVVVLAAGTLGSSELLLRSAEHGLHVSEHVGRRFSGNGDVLAFAYNTDIECNSVGFGSLGSASGQKGGSLRPVGPCISGVVRGDNPADLSKQFIIEEGSLPGPIAALLPAALSLASRVTGTRYKTGLIELAKQQVRKLASLVLGARHGAIRNSLVYLGMSFDDASGVMILVDDRLRISWPGVGRQPDALDVNARLRDGSAALAGIYVPDPIWSKVLGQRLITVHPLGGCVMGENAAEAVVDHRGEVFDTSVASPTGRHEGLYVMDGAVIPMAVGLNPSLTIAGVAERNCAILAEEHHWRIDMGSTTTPIAAVQPGIGIEFTEVMHGFFSDKVTTAQQPAEFDLAEKEGEQAGASIRFELTIRGDDVARMIGDSNHQSSMAGTVEAPTLASGPMTVLNGVFQCFSVDPTHVDTRNLVYRMTLNAQDGSKYAFHGIKVMTPSSILALWPQTTTLYVTLHDGPDETSTVKGQGVMHVYADDFLKQLSTMRATNAPDVIAGLRASARFGRFFAGHLFELYGGIFAHESAVDPAAPPRVRRPLRVPTPEVHPFVTDDGVELLLTRYRGGNKGPVMLSHGLGVSSLIFSIDTIATAMLEYLVAHGYDVWLLDYRASIVLPSAGTQFTGDEIARYDYPAAVHTVQQVTGARDIQVVAHCFGSTTFFMAMLAGLKGVRSAVCSQIGCHVIPVELTRAKAGLHLDGVLTALGVKTMTAYAAKGEGWAARLFDDMLSLGPVPAGEHCNSEVCHRITFLYSLLYEHDQLDDVTHSVLHEMFGVANVGAIDHLATMVRAGQIVDAAGQDTYLPNVERLAIPISIIHGAENQCFLPESTEKTLEWMSAANGASLYQRKLISGYGHIDCIFGRDAARDVYPYVLERLDITARA